jgi:hypothetical protein
MYKDLVRKFNLYYPQIKLFMIQVVMVVLGIRRQAKVPTSDSTGTDSDAGPNGTGMAGSDPGNDFAQGGDVEPLCTT